MGGVKNYFSGCEGKQHFTAVVKSGAEHCLTSYLYVRKQHINLLRQRKKQYPHMRFMVDSGAHTMQDLKNTQFQSWSVQDYQDYCKAYYEWLLENRKYIDFAVELDIDVPVNRAAKKPDMDDFGVQIVKEWQNKYFRPLEEKGLPIIYVWHEPRGMLGWEEMCSDFSYVGLGGELSSLPDFNKFMTVAKRYTTRIHGFAASVMGDSKIVVRSGRGEIRNLTIEQFYNECGLRTEDTSTGTGTAYPSETYETWSCTNDLAASFEKIHSVIRHRAERPIYRITLRGGKSIEGTGDHSFFALSNSGKLIEVKPSELKEGDHLVSSLGIPDTKSQNLSQRLAEFLGIWFGDGHVSYRQDGKLSYIWVSGQQIHQIHRKCAAMAHSRGRLWTDVPGTVDGLFTDTKLAKWIVERFGRIGEDKFLGSYILSASKTAQAAFLRGYFSADGCCKGRNKLISLGCFRRDILETVQIMLERWDIRSGISDAGLSGKVFPQWELAISDCQSRELFAEHIGFIQDDQTLALRRKNGTKKNAGCHRGLPISLLKIPGRLFRKRNGVMNSRPVYAKDRRTAEIEENFCDTLLNMDCEYLEIQEIKVVRRDTVDVYDLCVPTTERFFANGILAHNTKQSDFRDWPWASIDSTSWKDSERYGVLLHWDEHKQKFIYDQEKTRRHLYRQHMLKHGLPAEDIIAGKNYKAFTVFALISMTLMEKFYQRKYSTRVFYYELRLPHPRRINVVPFAELEVYWNKMRGEEIFKLSSPSDDEVREILFWISMVQYKDKSVLSLARAVVFFNQFFQSVLSNNPQDIQGLQKAVSQFIAPPNPPPMPRSTLVASNNPPQPRLHQEFTLADLEWSDDDYAEIGEV